MATSRLRGTPKEINNALNRPTTKFGLDYRLLSLAGFLSIAWFILASKIVACAMFPTLLFIGSVWTRKEPQAFRLWLLSYRLGSHYDPGKEAQ